MRNLRGFDRERGAGLSGSADAHVTLGRHCVTSQRQRREDVGLRQILLQKFFWVTNEISQDR
jgi:hypothetical protein